MRRHHLLSQNWVWIIFDPCFGKKTTTENRWNLDSGLCWRFFVAKEWVKYYPNSILRPYLESFHQGEPVTSPIWKRDWFFLSLVFSKFYLLCTNQKSSSYGRKWHCFDIHIPWYEMVRDLLRKPEKELWAKKERPSAYRTVQTDRQRVSCYLGLRWIAGGEYYLGG